MFQIKLSFFQAVLNLVVGHGSCVVRYLQATHVVLEERLVEFAHEEFFDPILCNGLWFLLGSFFLEIVVHDLLDHCGQMSLDCAHLVLHVLEPLLNLAVVYP